MTLDLTEKERTVLYDILESYLNDLRTERVGTDNKALRAELKVREGFTEDLLGRLKQEE